MLSIEEKKKRSLLHICNACAFYIRVGWLVFDNVGGGDHGSLDR